MMIFQQPEAIALIDGQAINIVDADDALAKVRGYLRAGKGFNFATLNLDHLVKLRQNPAFRAAYGRMSLVCADGAPVAALAREQAPSVRRTTGADLLKPLCLLAAQEGVPVAFFGSTQETLEVAAARLAEEMPGLVIAHLESPAFGFDPMSPEAARFGERIAASGAKLCFVCLGAPKQEIFADRMTEFHGEVGFVGLGASADFIAGTQARAPAMAQRLGLEWAWRMLSNPRRLAWRYTQCAMLLARISLERRLAPAEAGGFPIRAAGE